MDLVERVAAAMFEAPDPADPEAPVTPWRMSLPTMWDDVERTLGHAVRFLNEDERERMMP